MTRKPYPFFISEFIFRNLYFFPVFILIIINILSFRMYSLNWDSPLHIYAGIQRLGWGQTINYKYVPYGFVTELLPVLFMKIFPKTWDASTSLIAPVLIGSCGIIYYFRIIRRYFGNKTAMFASILLLLLPRYIGHLHTNIKDIGTSSFFIISVFYFDNILQKIKIRDAALFIFFQIMAINCKPASVLLLPVFFLWACFVYFTVQKKVFRIIKISLLLVLVFIISIFSWYMYSGVSIKEIPEMLTIMQSGSKDFGTPGIIYPIFQLFYTTPLPVLFFMLLGIISMVSKIIHEKNGIAFLFIFIFFYTILKYSVNGLRALNDIRYFIEIYYPLSIFCVIGADLLLKKRAVYIFLILFIYLISLNIIYFPYQITYNNILGSKNEPDFWCASYREVFDYLNNTLPKNTIISARLGSSLANLYLRPDLKGNQLMTALPEDADVVVITNNPALYKIFGLDEFFQKHQPQKIIYNRVGIPLSYIYFRNK